LPKRTDIKKILVIGSGPIVIGQACEFDYSGTQACKALKEEGYNVVLVNSNPATIMTDPNIADATYVEPLTSRVVEKVIRRERPDAVLPTMGGQTALNIAVDLAERGLLDELGVELIGAKLPAIKMAEDRLLFKKAMGEIGLYAPESGHVTSLEEGFKVLEKTGYPAIIRPSFTLGGAGGNIAYNREEFIEYLTWGLDASPVGQVLLESSILGWKEYELEVMRDTKDNVIIICSIENVDAMGVHTGDSITVAPAQTLTDKEYQALRDASIKIIRKIGVETGGSNIQFAVNPENGKVGVIEMNPRVSRSSALASKATGFPIAKIAAKLAVGYTLDEIPNDITQKTYACFEPSIDYCVVKFPRFDFEKFSQTDNTLTTQMKSVGEAMAIGRTFKESLLKSVRSLEIGSFGLETLEPELWKESASKIKKELVKKIKSPNADRLWYIADAFRLGLSINEVFEYSQIDPWFLDNIKQIIDMENHIKESKVSLESAEAVSLVRDAKKFGFSDLSLAGIMNIAVENIHAFRMRHNIVPVYKSVDTCAAEFVAYTPYFYSSYEVECEVKPTNKKKIMILGGGPNRIGQGIEFDYCCVQASIALKKDGFETIMVNCNPETVSTDYDTSDRLYFEPLTKEDVLHIVKKEKPDGVIVQFGGQTPLKLALPLEEAGAKIIGTSPGSIDRAEDRELFKEVINKLGLKQADNGMAVSIEEAKAVASSIGYPVLLRPSYVLGGRAMEIVYDVDSLENYMGRALFVSPEHPVLVDKFLDEATEIDVDGLCDGTDVFVAGIMEHIEEAGIHSGDSACSIPTLTLSDDVISQIEEQTKMLAIELNVIGLINIQFAYKGGDLYIIEVNPRGSRTVPFVSKTTGISLAQAAARVMAGKSIKELKLKPINRNPGYFSVKEAVFPFVKFPGVDSQLGPEMKSTGEVMGIDKTFDCAYAKAQFGAGAYIPTEGNVFINLKKRDRIAVVSIAKKLSDMGFTISSNQETYDVLKENNVPVVYVPTTEGKRPNVVDLMKNKSINMIINNQGAESSSHGESFTIRRTALLYTIPYYTTIAGATAVVEGIRFLIEKEIPVKPLQEYYDV